MSIATSVFVALGLGVIAPWVIERSARWGPWLLGAGLVAALLPLLDAAPRVFDGQPVREAIDWVPAIGLRFSFLLDGLSLVMALLILGIGGLVVVYAGAYLKGDPRLPRFFAIFLLFATAMLGLVLADNVLLVYVFWALTGLTSYLLIGYDHERERARGAALQALIVTFAGELAMLAGLLLLARAGGSMELSDLVVRGDQIAADPLFGTIVVLIVLGALTKSAQFPFHFWLPNAMEAPTPVSAYLHSATMVKAGVYLLARLHPALSGADAWVPLVAGAGLATMLVGGFLAMRQHEPKRMLAYSTVAALGIMVFLLGLGTHIGAEAALAFLVAHALYKGALFLVAGALDHQTDVRDVRRLGGLRRAMPLTAAAGILAGLSMAGVLPLFGFIGKELVLDAALQGEELAILSTGAVVFTGVTFVVVAGLMGLRPFLGARTELPRTPQEAPVGLWLGPLLLGALGLGVGIAPSVLEAPLSAAAGAVIGRTLELELVVWHGFTPLLGLSLLTLALGVLAFAAWPRIHAAVSAADLGGRMGPERLYRDGLSGVQVGSEGLARALQGGLLRRYLMLTLAVAIGLVGYSFAIHRGLPRMELDLAARPHELVIAAVVLVAAIAAARATSRLGAIAALGVVGYGVSLIYLLFGAPDLAMTQILIETLTVILFVLVLYHLPDFLLRSTRPARWRDAAISIGAGVVMTGLTLAALTTESDRTVSAFYLAESVPSAHGRNVVNTILVDFRVFDTLGEIVVLALAALGVYALLHLRPRRNLP